MRPGAAISHCRFKKQSFKQVKGNMSAEIRDKRLIKIVCGRLPNQENSS